MVQKIFVRCHYCDKKLRLIKEIGDTRAIYKIKDGTAKVVGSHLYFFCESDSAVMEL